MLDQLAGAASATVLFLAYVLLVECLTAACVLLVEFIVLRVRALRSLLVAVEPVAPVEERQPQSRAEPYRLGGDIRW